MIEIQKFTLIGARIQNQSILTAMLYKIKEISPKTMMRRAEIMAWQLKVFAALLKDLRSIPSTHVGQFTMPSDDLHRHRHSHKHRQKRKK